MRIFLVISFVIFFVSCSHEHTNTQKAFYYWKTNYKFNTKDRELAEKMKVDKFYLRFFDIKWNSDRNQAIPVGELTINNNAIYPKNYVPCVFITNDVMIKSSKDELKSIAKKLVDKINYMAKKINLLQENNKVENKKFYKELQIDCDWSIKSKENYFYFLKKLKKIVENKEISVTLRLWQLKHKQKSGIPPVDRVMLMCYSTGNPKNYKIDNSLASYNEIEKYVKGQSYDLPTDIALPIYSWAVLFRNRSFKSIIRSLNFDNVKSDTALFAHIHKNRYFFKKDTVMFDNYIRYGDEIRLESFDKTEMNKLINLLHKENFKLSNSVISFFSWDSTYIKNHGYENINAYYSNIIGN